MMSHRNNAAINYHDDEILERSRKEKAKAGRSEKISKLKKMMKLKVREKLRVLFYQDVTITTDYL